jgi:ABC-type multidrug transport system permease subunit
VVLEAKEPRTDGKERGNLGNNNSNNDDNSNIVIIPIIMMMIIMFIIVHYFFLLLLYNGIMTLQRTSPIELYELGYKPFAM